MNEEKDAFFVVSADTDFYAHGFLFPNIKFLFMRDHCSKSFYYLTKLAQDYVIQWQKKIETLFSSAAQKELTKEYLSSSFLGLQFLFGRYLSKTDYYNNFMSFITPLSNEQFFHPSKFPTIEIINNSNHNPLNFKINLLKLLRLTTASTKENPFKKKILREMKKGSVIDGKSTIEKILKLLHDENFTYFDGKYIEIEVHLSKSKKIVEFSINFKKEACTDFFWFLATAIFCLKSAMSFDFVQSQSFETMRNSSMESNEKQGFASETIYCLEEVLKMKKVIENSKEKIDSMRFDITIKNFELKNNGKFVFSDSIEDESSISTVFEFSGATTTTTIPISVRSFCVFPTFSAAAMNTTQVDAICEKMPNSFKTKRNSEKEENEEQKLLDLAQFQNSVYLKHVKKMFDPFAISQMVGNSEKWTEFLKKNPKLVIAHSKSGFKDRNFDDDDDEDNEIDEEDGDDENDNEEEVDQEKEEKNPKKRKREESPVEKASKRRKIEEKDEKEEESEGKDNDEGNAEDENEGEEDEDEEEEKQPQKKDISLKTEKIDIIGDEPFGYKLLRIMERDEDMNQMQDLNETVQIVKKQYVEDLPKFLKNYLESAKQENFKLDKFKWGWILFASFTGSNQQIAFSKGEMKRISSNPRK